MTTTKPHSVRWEGRAWHPAATLPTSKLETTLIDDDHNISRLHTAHASRTLIIGSCATCLHTAMYWRWCRIGGHGGRLVQRRMHVGRLTTLCRLWQHTWLVINDADIGRSDKSNAYATGCERDKNGQSIKCCPRERCRWTVHMHARHRLNVLLAVRRGRCPWTVEMNVLPSATVPMPDSRLLRLLSYRNTRPATPQRALLHRDPHRLLNTKQRLRARCTSAT